MPEPIDFYFDFSSPYGYIAATKITGLAARHARSVRWRPFLLGAVYKETGQLPLENALKRDYLFHDLPRHARFHSVPFKFPATFPEALVAAARAVCWIEDRAPEKAGPFAEAAYRAYWAEGRRLAEAEVVAELAATQGFAKADVLAGLNDAGLKDRFRAANDAALQRGVFGSPFIFVDGEPFWGSDRLDEVERWLATGGW